MVEADWGAEDGGPRWHGFEPVVSDRPEDVPEVAATAAQGYEPAPEAPLWCFLPAIWPASARAWVRDTRVRHLTRQCDDGPVERLPWSAADYADIEDDINGLLAELGLPRRPGGRIWLLRPPSTYASLAALLDDVWAGWQASGGEAMASPAFVEYVADRLREVFGST